ncbi:MAG: hypothetical protein N3E47_07930 [Candidatus Bathyarchaeota archaeon]|nr:hypothetical protein [Candidatus Bathyarchaeota archaeon]
MNEDLDREINALGVSLIMHYRVDLTAETLMCLKPMYGDEAT